MKPFYIYFILNKLTGKYYVGQTIQTPEKRWIKHQRDARNRKFKNNYFSNAVRYYRPENFEVRVLYVCYDQKTLDEAEIYFIAFFKATNAWLGYNGTFGGKGGKKTEAAKSKMSSSQKGRVASPETRAKMSKAGKGKKQDPEHIRKRALAITGKPKSAESIRKTTAGLTGRKNGPMSQETKQKLRVKATGRGHTEETREKLRKPHTEERRLNVIEGLRKRRERLEQENQLWETATTTSCFSTPHVRMDLPPRGLSGKFIRTGSSTQPSTETLLLT